MGATREAATAVVDALGAAWSIHSLYPDPLEQPAFIRSVDGVREVGGDTFVVTVSPGGFIFEGEELEGIRGSSDRLAKRLYVHNVDALEVSAQLSERDVVKLFDLVGRSEEDVIAGGGVGAALARDGVSSFSVTDRAPLAESAHIQDTVERDAEVVSALAGGEDPAAYAEEFTTAGGNVPEVVAHLVFERYMDVMERIGPEDVAGRESAVQAFVEMFFHLRDEIQNSVLSRFLDDHDSPDVQPFLDQFAGHELVKFAPQLDPKSFSLLMSYAEIVTDPEADGRSQDLLGLLKNSEGEVATARGAIAREIDSRFSNVSMVAEGEAGPKVDIPDPRRYFFTVLDGFRDLLDVEERPERFRRILRIWSGKVKACVRRADIRRAELWIRAVVDNPTWSAEWKTDVDRALESTVTDELLRQLLALGEEKLPEVQRFVAVAGEVAVRPLISVLAESDSGTRRPIMDLLENLAVAHPEPIVAAAGEAPWYLARNLAIVLRNARAPQAAPLMAQLASHDDARVRVEAIRGLAVLGAEDSLTLIAECIGDDDDGVRSTALTALGTSARAGAEEILVESISSPKLSPTQRARAIELLGRKPTDETRALLERLAGKRLALTATARQIKAAARKALEVA